MKTFVTLLAILLAMVFVVPAFAGEEPYKAAIDDDYWSFHGNCSITKTQPCLTDRDCPPGHCSITTETTCYEGNDCPHRHCSRTGDGCLVDLDCPGDCSIRGDECLVDSDCPGLCPNTYEECSVDSDCPGFCSLSGGTCLEDSDCPEDEGSDYCVPGYCDLGAQDCDKYQSCDADPFDTETCSAIETCLLANSNFHISPKLDQFTHENTAYYKGCEDVLFPPDPRITADCKLFGGAFLCPSACREYFKAKATTPVDQPEVCCAQKIYVMPVPETIAAPPADRDFCPDKEPWGKTALTSAGNAGEYTWVIALPKKPEGELNLEMQCGVLKPNSWTFFKYDAINVCAAVTGEPVGPNCTRVTGAPLITSGLPRLEVIAHPGCNNDFEPFHLTAYKNPGQYAVTSASGHLTNSTSLQVLDGTVGSRIALKACLEKTVLVKWPKAGLVNVLGEREAALEAGDLIKVRMKVPAGNTIDLYCGKYSVTIGGIGEPNTLLDDENCDCISDANCQF